MEEIDRALVRFIKQNADELLLLLLFARSRTTKLYEKFYFRSSILRYWRGKARAQFQPTLSKTLRVTATTVHLYQLIPTRRHICHLCCPLPAPSGSLRTVARPKLHYSLLLPAESENFSFKLSESSRNVNVSVQYVSLWAARNKLALGAGFPSQAAPEASRQKAIGKALASSSCRNPRRLREASSERREIHFAFKENARIKLRARSNLKQACASWETTEPCLCVASFLPVQLLHSEPATCSLENENEMRLGRYWGSFGGSASLYLLSVSRREKPIEDRWLSGKPRARVGKPQELEGDRLDCLALAVELNSLECHFCLDVVVS